MSALAFPKPGELHNAAAVPVPERDLAVLLVQAAEHWDDHRGECPGCDGCMAARVRWHSLLNTLSVPLMVNVLTTVTGPHQAPFPPNPLPRSGRWPAPTPWRRTNAPGGCPTSTPGKCLVAARHRAVHRHPAPPTVEPDRRTRAHPEPPHRLRVGVY